jgi:hypothetical protein
MYTIYLDCDDIIENYVQFSTLEKIIEYEEYESNWLSNTYPESYIPYDDYIKDAEFISWDYANKTVKTKYDSIMYKLKLVREWGKGRNVNGDWEYIPIMSSLDDGGDVVNIWVEIDYSRKIFI